MYAPLAPIGLQTVTFAKAYRAEAIGAADGSRPAAEVRGNRRWPARLSRLLIGTTASRTHHPWPSLPKL